MSLKIYNTLTRTKEEFVPLKEGQVNMYVCGITPYDETHLGHGRAYVTFDIVRRYLEYSGYKVFYAQNITDVDDKIIQKSNLACRQAGVKGQNFSELTEEYIKKYFEVMDSLNVKRANIYPKATEHIGEMIDWIKGLIDKGNAYVIENDVYFSVTSFKDYGKLSNRKLDDMLAGARVAKDERKKDPMDFALWKAAKEGEPSWDSPWGQGRPGWHIECSVMSTKYLGEQFDIHGGGMDLMFPHHENEIAQTQSNTGKPWVKYWMHNGFVNINKQKMSKSLGNFFALKDIFEKFDPMVIRLFLLLTHYRSPINYSDQEMNSAKEAYAKICAFVENLDFLLSKTKMHAPKIEEKDINEELQRYEQQFIGHMDDDFNTAGAIAAIFDLVHFCNKTLAEGDTEKECLLAMKTMILELCDILGLRIVPVAANLACRQAGFTLPNEAAIKKLVKEREIAKKNKDFARADQIRKELAEQGIVLEDTVHGTRWKHA